MEQNLMSEIKAGVFPPQNGNPYVVAAKWEGWGVKGEGPTLELAIADLVKEVLDYERSKKAA